MNPIPTCRDGTERLMEYMDGVLDEGLRRAIDEHIAGCARCQAFVKSFASVPSIMRAATGGTLTPSGEDALRRALAARRHS
jgi:anti-sigma factor RsiW